MDHGTLFRCERVEHRLDGLVLNLHLLYDVLKLLPLPHSYGENRVPDVLHFLLSQCIVLVRQGIWDFPEKWYGV